MIFETYKTLSITFTSIILIALLLGVNVEIKPFKYSLKNLLK